MISELHPILPLSRRVNEQQVDAGVTLRPVDHYVRSETHQTKPPTKKGFFFSEPGVGGKEKKPKRWIKLAANGRTMLSFSVVDFVFPFSSPVVFSAAGMVGR